MLTLSTGQHLRLGRHVEHGLHQEHARDDGGKGSPGNFPLSVEGFFNLLGGLIGF